MSQSTQQSLSSAAIKSTKLTMSIVGITITCLLFAVPLGLVYNFVYMGSKGGLLPNIMVFLLAYLIGFIANLLFYRVIVMNDMDAQINKVKYGTVAYVMGLTLCGFTVLLLTQFALAVAPNLITIFENTFGYWFVSLLGLSNLMRRIFSSPTLDPYVKNSRVSDFNYNFLITCIKDDMDVDNIIKVMQSNKTKNERAGFAKNTEIVELFGEEFGLDFVVKGDPILDGNRLKKFVHLKRAFGHYMWTYFASILSIMISMIAVIIGSS